MPARIAEGREAEIFAWDAGTVLRLYRDPDADALADREMAVLAAVRSVMPLVPARSARIVHDGRPGIVMERVDEHGVYDEITRQPWRVWSLAALVGHLHAELHAVIAPRTLPDTRSVLPARIAREPDIPADLRDAALTALEALPDGDRLCHGDFQPDNVLLRADGVVIIDWGHAMRGDPDADFARTAVMMRAGGVPAGTPALIRWGSVVGRGAFCRAYVRGYARSRPYDETRVNRWSLVRLADRLADRIPDERAALLRAARRLAR